jgi:hypothetical protein
MRSYTQINAIDRAAGWGYRAHFARRAFCAGPCERPAPVFLDILTPDPPVVEFTTPGTERHAEIALALRGYVVARDALHFIDDCAKLDDGRYAWRLVRAWVAGQA